MAQELKLQTQTKPSIFNRDMLLWGMIAPMAAALVPTAAVGAGAFYAIQGGLMAAGGLIGGMIGKAREQRENIEGKPVKQGGFFNKKMLIGLLLPGTVIGIGLAAATAMVGVAPVIGAIGSLGAAGAITAAVTALALPVIGAIIGGVSGKREQQREFDQALEQTIDRARDADRANVKAPVVEFDNPQPEKKWAKQIEQERALQAQHAR